jgi:metalloendopeptidase OMA1, mitochondrial
VHFAAQSGARPLILGRWRGLAKLLLAAVLCPGMLAGGCAPANQEGPGHRSQHLALSPDQELALGRQAYDQVLSKAHAVRDGPQVERVRQVSERIVKASEIEPLQREINLRIQGYRFDWEFNVLEDRHVNAFCLPGGKVAVFTGLLSVVQNDDQLATVLSHEIAHALAHHASERIDHQQMYETAVQAAGGVLGQMDPERRKELIGLLAAGAQLGSLPFDRRQESEADHIGLFLMTFAGYDPRQAIVLWEEMERLSSRHGRPPEFLSDHPSDAQRIAKIREWLPQAEAAKKAWDEGRIAPAPGRR